MYWIHDNIDRKVVKKLSTFISKYIVQQIKSFMQSAN